MPNPIEAIRNALKKVPASEGLAKHYSAGRFEQTYATRIRQGLIKPGAIAGYDGMASTPYCSNIGKTLIARFLNPKTKKWSGWERFLVCDCSRPGEDQQRHIAANQTEYDFATALRHGWEWDGHKGEGKTRVKTWIVA